MIPLDEKKYQCVSLDNVKAYNAEEVHKKLIKNLSIHESKILNFCVQGELVCQKTFRNVGTKNSFAGVAQVVEQLIRNQ